MLLSMFLDWVCTVIQIVSIVIIITQSIFHLDSIFEFEIFTCRLVMGLHFLRTYKIK